MKDKKEIKTLDAALDRIEELEAGIQQAIDVVLKRDDQLRATERRILELEDKLESLSSHG